MTAKRAPAQPYTIRTVGGPRAPLSDLYHVYLRTPWWVALIAIVSLYLILNAFFACTYLLFGGIANARSDSFADAFFFSIQTMGTIGYGAMYPSTPAANAIVVAESVTGLLVTALATGMVFAKFSLSNSRVAFTHQAVITPMDGVPTLMFRLGNLRSNRIIDATLRLVLMRTEITKEGTKLYRMHDLQLARDRTPAMSRSWTVLHPITSTSPLFGKSPDDLKKDEAELLATLFGVDDTSLQQVHAQRRFMDTEIIWGARHVDILNEDADGNLTLDLTKFHDFVATPPTPEFPYPTKQNPTAQNQREDQR